MSNQMCKIHALLHGTIKKFLERLVLMLVQSSDVLERHSFVVIAGISVIGKILKWEFSAFWFCCRIRLLFGKGYYCDKDGNNGNDFNDAESDGDDVINVGSDGSDREDGEGDNFDDRSEDESEGRNDE